MPGTVGGPTRRFVGGPTRRFVTGAARRPVTGPVRLSIAALGGFRVHAFSHLPPTGVIG